jgi:hypothetical protein
MGNPLYTPISTLYSFGHALFFPFSYQILLMLLNQCYNYYWVICNVINLQMLICVTQEHICQALKYSLCSNLNDSFYNFRSSGCAVVDKVKFALTVGVDITSVVVQSIDIYGDKFVSHLYLPLFNSHM